MRMILLSVMMFVTASLATGREISINVPLSGTHRDVQVGLWDTLVLNFDTRAEAAIGRPANRWISFRADKVQLDVLVNPDKPSRLKVNPFAVATPRHGDGDDMRVRDQWWNVSYWWQCPNGARCMSTWKMKICGKSDFDTEIIKLNRPSGEDVEEGSMIAFKAEDKGRTWRQFQVFPGCRNNIEWKADLTVCGPMIIVTRAWDWREIGAKKGVKGWLMIYGPLSQAPWMKFLGGVRIDED